MGGVHSFWCQICLSFYRNIFGTFWEIHFNLFLAMGLMRNWYHPNICGLSNKKFSLAQRLLWELREGLFLGGIIELQYFLLVAWQPYLTYLPIFLSLENYYKFSCVGILINRTRVGVTFFSLIRLKTRERIVILANPHSFPGRLAFSFNTNSVYHWFPPRITILRYFSWFMIYFHTFFLALYCMYNPYNSKSPLSPPKQQ